MTGEIRDIDGGQPWTLASIYRVMLRS